MFRKASGDIKKIKVDDGFDAGHPVAHGLRRLMPPAGEMRPGSHERIRERTLEMREGIALGVPAVEGGAGRSRRKRLPSISAAVIVLILAGVAVPVLLTLLRTDGAGPAKQYARIDSREGHVEVLDGAGRWRKARNGDSIAPGSAIRTSPSAVASVSFPDGSAMRVTDESEVRIADIGASSAVIEHVSGGTYHRVEDGSDYVVLNSDVQTRSGGSVFNVENRVPGSLEIVTLDRSVVVEIGEHRPITVNSGEVMVVATAGEKKADKQAVSRERLEEDRLLASASRDAQAGYSTGVYERLDVSMDSPPEKPAPEPAPTLAIELKGSGTETGGMLTWSVTGGADFDILVLLRSIEAGPTYPDGEIARYADTSITSAADNSVLQEHTYQYRLAAVESGDVIAYSNTLVVTIPKSTAKPARASVSLVANRSEGEVHLEWTVAGASGFSGFALERVVESAPADSAARAGSRTTVRIESRDILYSYADASAESGCAYSYRVGLVVDGSLMVYSNTVTVR